MNYKIRVAPERSIIQI